MSGEGRLDRFYDVPIAVTARLVGGPFDGQEQSVPGGLLADICPRLWVALPVSLVGGFDPAEWPPKPEHAVYEALRDANGFFSRDDEGRVRFDFWGLR